MSMFDAVKRYLRDNKHYILGGVQLASLGFSTYFTAKSAIKAYKLIEDMEMEGGEATKKEKIVTVAKTCVPAVISTLTCAGTMVYGIVDRQNERSVLISLASGASAMLTKFKEKMDPEELKRIEKEIREESMPESIKNDDLETEDDLKMFYDDILEQWFRAKYTDVLKACLDAEYLFAKQGGRINVTDYYTCLMNYISDYSDLLPEFNNKYDYIWWDYECFDEKSSCIGFEFDENCKNNAELHFIAITSDNSPVF